MIEAPLKRLATLSINCHDTEDRPIMTLEDVEAWTGRIPADEVWETLKNPPASGFADVRAGDVLFGKLRPYLAKVVLVDRPAYASTELMRLRPEPYVDPRWFYYRMQSEPVVAYAVATSQGTKMPRTSWDRLGEFVSPLPSLEAQRAIADFLDAETARIDALIETKHRISDAVHDKLLHSVDVSTSRGPITSLRRVIKLRTSGPRGWSSRIGNGGVPFVRSGNLTRDDIELSLEGMAHVPLDISTGALRSRIAAGDVLVGITGANTAWVAVADASTVGGHVSQHVALLRPSHVTGRWLAYCLLAPSTRRALLESQYGGTKQQLGLDELAELSIAVPSIEDQRHRVDYLDNLRTAVVEARQAIARSITLLQERRRALITAAVTGQMAVPGVEAA